jgi:hypothetical protein
VSNYLSTVYDLDESAGGMESNHVDDDDAVVDKPGMTSVLTQTDLPDQEFLEIVCQAKKLNATLVKYADARGLSIQLL